MTRFSLSIFAALLLQLSCWFTPASHAGPHEDVSILGFNSADAFVQNLRKSYQDKNGNIPAGLLVHIVHVEGLQTDPVMDAMIHDLAALGFNVNVVQMTAAEYDRQAREFSSDVFDSPTSAADPSYQLDLTRRKLSFLQRAKALKASLFGSKRGITIASHFAVRDGETGKWVRKEPTQLRFYHSLAVTSTTVGTVLQHASWTADAQLHHQDAMRMALDPRLWIADAILGTYIFLTTKFDREVLSVKSQNGMTSPKGVVTFLGLSLVESVLLNAPLVAVLSGIDPKGEINGAGDYTGEVLKRAGLGTFSSAAVEMWRRRIQVKIKAAEVAGDEVTAKKLQFRLKLITGIFYWGLYPIASAAELIATASAPGEYSLLAKLPYYAMGAVGVVVEAWRFRKELSRGIRSIFLKSSEPGSVACKYLVTAPPPPFVPEE